MHPQRRHEELRAAISMDLRTPQMILPNYLPSTEAMKVSIPSTCMVRRKNDQRTFAQKLFDILEHGWHADIITWLAGGKAFMIVDRERFCSEVLPLHFKQSKFTSFTRKLSRWQFIRIRRGPSAGGYAHKLFSRGNRPLCRLMKCNGGGEPIMVDPHGLNFLAAGAQEASRSTILKNQSFFPLQGPTAQVNSSCNHQAVTLISKGLEGNVLSSYQKNYDLVLKLRMIEKEKDFLIKLEARRRFELQLLKDQDYIVSSAARTLERSGIINCTSSRNMASTSSSRRANTSAKSIPALLALLQGLDQPRLSSSHFSPSCA